MILFNILFAILLAPEMVKGFAPVVRYVKLKTGAPRLKPLDCAQCLAFWVTLAMSYSYAGLLISIAGAWCAFKIMGMIEQSTDEYTIE